MENVDSCIQSDKIFHNSINAWPQLDNIELLQFKQSKTERETPNHLQSSIPEMKDLLTYPVDKDETIML